jgi:arylsulfatase A-like enzyme
VHGVALWETDAAPTLNPRVDTLAEALKNAGYDTFAVTAGAHMHRDRGFGQGFDVFQHGRQLERALAFLRGSHRRPFFLFFHTYEVHDPYAPPTDVARAFAAEPVPAIAAAVDEIRADTRGGPRRTSVSGRRSTAPTRGTSATSPTSTTPASATWTTGR